MFESLTFSDFAYYIVEKARKCVTLQTDMAKKNVIDPNGVIGNWMRNRNTIEYLGLWETLHNPNFNPLEFEGFCHTVPGTV